MYTCLAVGKTSESVRELVKEYFSKLGYCLIEVSNDGVEVVAEATPRKVPRSERDYNEVVSRGLLYIATRQVLLDKGYGDEELNITSQWVGLKRPINYYGILLGDHAVIGFYARGLDKAKRLLSFLRSNEGLVESLAKNGYRMYLESYMVVAGVRGYMRHFDEPLNLDVVKSLIDKLKLESKPKQTSKQGSGIKRGLGFGLYKKLWSIDNAPPSYPTALNEVKKTLSTEELGALEELIPSTKGKT